MKNFYTSLVFLLLISTCLNAQNQENSGFKNVNFAFGMALNLESLDKTVAEEAGVSSTGFTLIDFRGRLALFKYLMINIGGSVSQFKDKLPFDQAVVFTSGQLSGLPSTATSEIVSGGWYYSVGARAPLTKRLYLNANIGERRFSASRKIPSCSNCKKTEIDNLNAGSYLRGGFSWMTFEEKVTGELDLLYTYYFKEEFKSTITLGFFVYF